MNGSGCKTCPVKPCQTLTYRGSTCTAQRARHGLGDPQTNMDIIRAMDAEELAKFLLYVDSQNLTADICDEKDCNGVECSHDCTQALESWLLSSPDGDPVWKRHTTSKE